MIMRHELSDRIPQPFLTKEDHLLQATLFDRADEPFRICIQIRRPRWQFHGFDADRTKCGQKFPVYNGSRSWIKYRFPTKKPSTASVRLRAI